MTQASSPSSPAGIPTAGYTVPGQYRVADRMPETDPFVARPSRSRLALLFGFIAFCAGGPLLFNTFLLPRLAGDDARPSPFQLFAVGAVAVALVAFVVNWYVLVNRGPVLAVGPDGLWLRMGKSTAKSVWLPWTAVDRIYLRRWFLDKQLCVGTRDPRAGAGAGVIAAGDRAVNRLLMGSSLGASVVYSDKRAPEILDAVTRYSAGRCRIG